MDDNKILTLANNDRIPMLRPNVTRHFVPCYPTPTPTPNPNPTPAPNQVTLQMEVEDLRNASPATVSRAGVIFISSNDLGWRPMAQGYLKNRRKAEVRQLLLLD